MEKGKRISSKLRQLFNLRCQSRRKFASEIDVPFTTLGAFISGNRNLTFKHFIRVLEGLGIDLESFIDNALMVALAGKNVKPTANHDDIGTLINSLKKEHRRELIRKAINLNKVNGNKVITEVIDRIEKTQLH